MSKDAKKRAGVRKVKRACGLCGKTRKLVKTPCCDNWICNDERNYIPFAYFSSCYRNHRRYTLCAFHHTEGHEGKWQECSSCLGEFTGIDFEDFANGSFNFEKLEDFVKIKCLACGFKSESKEDFAFEIDDDYYCTNNECQKVGKPPSRKNTKKKAQKNKVSKAVVKKVKKACGLCKKNRKLTKTECCDNWICDDEHKYRLFSFALNSCHRNHKRYTLCGFHHVEGHEGKWQECAECKDGCSEFQLDDWGNGSFNFEKLEDFGKISCVVCGFKSKSKEDFAFQLEDDYYCTKEECQRVGKPPSGKSTKRKVEKNKVIKAVAKKVKNACGLCGETKKLLLTECCNNLACTGRNKCHMSHRKYTLCAYHCIEGHEGKWQECLECRKEFRDIDYNDYANGSYTFEKLENYPEITRTCVACGFKSNSLGDFALKINNEFYCTKDECQQRSRPPLPNDSVFTAKCKDDCSEIQLIKDFASGSVKKLEDSGKIKCVACVYKSESKEDFAFQLDGDYYCTKEECQNVGKPPSGKSTKRKAEKNKLKKTVAKKVKNACGLCGETKKLLLTECCNNLACTGINKCHLSHRKYSLCAYHCTESHEGKWQECLECRKEFSDIDYNDGANGWYTFAKLKDYPEITKTCVACGFKSNSLGDFALKINNEFYCTKGDCQKKGKPNDSVPVAKCKDDCVEIQLIKDFTNSSVNFEKLEDVGKIKCIVCGFKSVSKEDFAFELNDGYYCTKDVCQRVGKPPPCNNTKNTKITDFFSKKSV